MTARKMKFQNPLPSDFTRYMAELFTSDEIKKADETLLESSRTELQADLLELRSQISALTKKQAKATELLEQAKARYSYHTTNFEKAHQTFRMIDAQLAEIDGRLEVLRYRGPRAAKPQGESPSKAQATPKPTKAQAMNTLKGLSKEELINLIKQLD